MDLRKLLLRFLLMGVPFALVFGVVAVVDPYNKFRVCDAVPDTLKQKNLYHDGRTMAFSNLMWELTAFDREPCPNVIIGDSRLSYFPIDHLDEVTRERWFNFGVPGGNYRSMFDTFWHADSVCALKNVYLQVSFRGMNAANNWDVFHEPKLVSAQPLMYLTSRRVIEATALNIRSLLAPRSVHYDVLPPDQWQRVKAMERSSDSSFVYDPKVVGELERIATRCGEKNIHLVLVDFPTHADVQALHNTSGLEHLRASYRVEMASIATYLDLDTDSGFARDRANFRDPLHLTRNAQRELIDVVWGGRKLE